MPENIEFEHSAIFANVTERKLRTLLLPWGELSRQSPTTKPIRFDRGRVKVPRDISIVGANVAHDPFSPVGRAVEIADTDKGIVAVFSIAQTDDGDKLLAEAKTAWDAGTPLKVSPELRNITRNGEEGLGAELIGAGFVPEGAFQSAAVFSFATEVDTETDAEKIARLQAELAAPPPHTPTPAPAAVATPPAAPASLEEENPMGLPNTLVAKTAATPTAPVSYPEAIGIFNAVRDGSVTTQQLDRLRPTLTTENGVFVLTDVKYDGANSVQPDERRSKWLNELWSGLVYEQLVIPLLNHDTLTAKKVAGFRWTTKPTGGDWAGNKSNIPSNQPVTAPADATAAFWAMGHDHAIEHEIFDTPGYFESYFAAGRESYAAWADAKVLAVLLAAAEDVVADNPTGLVIGAGWSALIDGATEVIGNNALPTFALVAPALWKSMLKTPADNILGYLSASLGLREGDLAGFKIRPHASVTTGHILVGAKQAATVYELSDIIKVTAPDTTKGGIDTNMIGAAATLVHKTDALVDVAPYVGA